ncbi:MAG TPA: hypothetical protein VGE41_06270 [Verrucomicrobiae bacterium]
MKLPCACLLFLITCCCAFTAELQVDFQRTNGSFRAFHGVNKGPLAPGGLLDLTAAYKELGIPYVRLHDCHWPNPDVVDIHTVFPNPSAVPERPENYDFALTDEYIAAVRQTGAQLVYRLGESIEHNKHKRFVFAPKDTEKWAAICLGIIRHYNDGWASGFHYQIPYWEIWNEPENRPAMWNGSDEDYLRLYRTASRKIKAAFPILKIGGPAVGYSGAFKAGRFQTSDFVKSFLASCKKEGLPLDFFSWHCYSANPAELVERSIAIRALLDANGFVKTESHLNEWNYLPGNSWKPVSKSAAPEFRENNYREMAGPAGATFISCALLELQDAPVDICNLFHGEAGGFGLFSENGVPQPNYYALLAFHDLLQLPQRAWTSGGTRGALDIAAARDDQRAGILISNYAQSESNIDLVLKGCSYPCRYELRRISKASPKPSVENGILTGPLHLEIKKPQVAFILIDLK